MAKTKKVKGPKGKSVRVATTAKPVDKTAPVKEEKVLTPGSYVSTEDLFEWFKATYPNNQPVDRDNGRTFHLKGKKIVKIPTQENKGGCFFGKHLNGKFDILKDRLGPIMGNELKVHTKGNYKVPRTVKVEVFNGIKWIIADMYPPEQFSG